MAELELRAPGIPMLLRNFRRQRACSLTKATTVTFTLATMNQRNIWIILLALLSIGHLEIRSSPAGETASPASAPSTTPSGPVAADVLGAYKDLKLMTPEPVYVDRGLALLCRGANQADVQRAQKTSGPHAYSTIRVFMNAEAAGAFPRSDGVYPVGSVIVKEKSPFSYRDDNGKLVERKSPVGGMIKRAAGYDPKHGDWEYFYAEADAKPEIGRIDSCRDCHANAAKKDYVFGQWAGTGRNK